MTWRNLLPTLFVSVALTALVAWLIAMTSFRMGYTLGKLDRPKMTQAEVDAQCVSWWTETDLKDAKDRLLKGAGHGQTAKKP